MAFLSAASGGGHHGTARALGTWLTVVLGRPVELQTIDVYQGSLAHLPWLSRLRNHSNLLWQAFAWITARRPVLRVLTALLRRRVVKSALAQIDPRTDLLISVHFASAACIDEIARALPGQPRTLTVATDYAPHPAWFGKAELTVLSQWPGTDLGLRHGLSGHAILGVPLLPCVAVGGSGSRKRIQEEQQLHHVVAAMGADGTSGRKLAGLLRAIDRQPWATQLTIDVACGNNVKLRRALLGLAQRLTRLRIRPLGYVDDLAQRMADADLALLRCSPLVLTEALASGTPVLAFDWHAHEGANAALLSHWGCGYACRSIGKAVAALGQWVADPDAFHAICTHARNIARSAFDAEVMRDILIKLNQKETPQ